MNRNWSYQVAAAVILVATLLLINPTVEAGMNDDWSFIFTARQLAATEHLRYNGWAAPLIGFQAYWAALFIKLFGFSFLAVRASVWVLALLAIPVLFNLLRLAGLTEERSFFGVVFFQLSPLVLPNLSTFMTDMPAFWLFTAALYSALKGCTANNEKTALRWLAVSTACSILSGSVRQIYWMAGVCFLLTAGILRIRSLRGRASVTVLLVCIVAFGAAASYWLAHQPYVPADTTLRGFRESSWQEILASAGGDSFRNILGVAVLCLPLTLPLAWRVVNRLYQIPVLVLSAIVSHLAANPLPWLGNTITKYGVILSGTVSLGDKPVILPDWFIWLLASAGLFCLINAVPQIRRCRFAVLTLPFLLLYTLVIAIRAPGFGLYDRYVIPHLFIFSVLALTAYGTIQRVTLVLSGIFALYAIATTHDYFAEARARLEATNQVLNAGNERTSVMGGFEFDSWTQIEKTGHVNNSLLEYPGDAFQELDDCSGPDDVQAWWRDMVPALAARYVVTLTPIPDLKPSGFRTIEYRRWLPFGTYRVFVQTLGKGVPPLTCRASKASLPADRIHGPLRSDKSLLVNLMADPFIPDRLANRLR